MDKPKYLSDEVWQRYEHEKSLVKGVAFKPLESLFSENEDNLISLFAKSYIDLNDFIKELVYILPWIYEEVNATSATDDYNEHQFIIECLKKVKTAYNGHPKISASHNRISLSACGIEIDKIIRDLLPYLNLGKAHFGGEVMIGYKDHAAPLIPKKKKQATAFRISLTRYIKHYVLKQTGKNNYSFIAKVLSIMFSDESGISPSLVANC